MGETSATDQYEALFFRLKAQEPAAQREFWSTHWGLVYRVCAHILGDGLPADEIAVEVLSDFMTDYVFSLSRAGAMKSYLRITAARRAIAEKKRCQRIDWTDMDGIEQEKDLPAEEVIQLSDTMSQLERCMQRLKPKARQALKLHYWAEWTNEKIGELLGGKKQYIGRLIKHSLSSLKTCLEQQSAMSCPDEPGVKS